MFSLSQSNILMKIFLWVSHINKWNMNIDGMLTEDEVKKVATQMITEKTTAGPFDRPRDSKSSLVQFATTKIRGLVVCKGGYLRGGSHPDWNLISINFPV